MNAEELAERKELAREAAAACSRLLKERFGARRVILFGSIAGQGGWHAESDIDLAVEGLPPAEFFPAYKGVYIDFGVHIGDNVKIQNGVSVYHGVTLEDGVFCGPHCVFTNDWLWRSGHVRCAGLWPGLWQPSTLARFCVPVRRKIDCRPARDRGRSPHGMSQVQD